MNDGRTTVVVYRNAQSLMLLGTLAAASVEGGVLHTHGPALHGDQGDDVAATIERVAASRGAEARVWDGDAPTDAAGVQRLCSEVGAHLLVVEWQPRMVEGHLDLARQVLEEPPCDVLVVRPGSLSRIEKLTVAVGPGPNAPLVAALAKRMAGAFGIEAEALRGVDTDAELEAARKLCGELAPDLPARVEVGRDLVNLLVDAADRNGLLALGASEGVPLDRLGVRTVGTRLAHRADATIVVGRVAT